jgi:DNA mismatch repair ATPase MutL
VIATNLYYHCWFARARLSRDSALIVGPHVALPFSSFSSLFLLLLSSSSTTPHTHTHTHTKTKERKKEQNQKKNKETTKTSNKDTKLKNQKKERDHENLKQNYTKHKKKKKQRKNKENQRKKKKIMNRKRVWQKKTMNLEPCSGVELGFIPSKKNPKTRFFGSCTNGCWVTQAHPWFKLRKHVL